jgi:hypothetical protein
LHPGNGFTGNQRPEDVLTADQGEMIIRFKTDALESSGGFSAVFSADCPQLVPGEGAIGTSEETVFGARVRFTCPDGQIFATGVEKIDTRCMPGGKWSQEYIPKCQQVNLF